MKTLICALALTVAIPALAEVKVGSPAPAFSEQDATGKTHTLAEYKGKWLVLEWYNKDCPYVKKHYGSKNMQKLQEEAKSKGAVWLVVNSGKEGAQGYLDAAGTLADMKSSGSNATASLIDVDGNMGKAYGAKTTPHMYVINPEGQVVYAGAIDSAMAGKEVAVKSSKPYGCAVKY